MAVVTKSRRILGVRRTVFVENLWFYAFLAPWIVGFLAFTLGPMVASLGLSFAEWDITVPPRLVGAANWTRLLHDQLFWQSLKVTLIYTAMSVPTGLVTGFALALLMNSRAHGIAFFRTLYYVPSLVSGVALAQLWKWIFDPTFGLANNLLALVGIKGPMWIYSTEWVLPSFVLMGLWGAGGAMVIYLSALQGVPTEVYEAADLDGASGSRKLFSVTIPMVSPAIFFNLIMGVIGTLQVFTQGYVMTQGGPANASLFYVLYLYLNAFKWFRMGYASVLAWVLFAIIGSLTLLLFRVAGERVFYEV